MGKRHEAGIESAAAVFHHPVHPMLVPLPIAAFVAAFAADVVHLFVPDPFWSLAAFWLLVAGLVTGGVAMVAGAIDFMTLPGVRSLEAAQVHAVGNLGVLTIALCNLGVRWYQPGAFARWFVLLSAATVGLLTITGWLGGALAYKHRIGQIAPRHGGAPAADHGRA